MNPAPSRPTLTTRGFLKLAAALGVTAAGAYLLADSAPWLDYDDEVRRTWRAPALDRPASERLRELVRAATLAANGHNTQPWRFAIATDAIEIRPDFSRRIPVVDPDDRELWISLGCALENLVVAARAGGYAPQVTYPDTEDVIRVALTPDTSQTGPLLDAIPLRQTTRSEYDGRPLPSAEFDRVQNLALEPGIALRWVTTPQDRDTVLDYVTQGNVNQYTNTAFVDELMEWLRFNRREALSALDGLYTRSSGNAEVPRWLGQMFVGGTDPQAQADADASKLRSSAGVVVVASDREDRTAWVRAGQVYERLALTLTSRDIKSAFLNQPIEVAALRDSFRTALGLTSTSPQLLVRYGYGDWLPRSLRRPVDQVMEVSWRPLGRPGRARAVSIMAG